ncbi:heavy metal translocating P-type ATPase [Streptomyces gobiensis]|uniref:heavy metal translocating P-type ATPase n=1 Tax=Streptomyces gobiensis TaxID=2875706 RepID=UPI001E5A13BB|nr:heavy metal translocating P-type ATPase [Streptomyces gobiensis]UGY91256.1 cadmium-translocating P-type ATPase [Streptomyces gobiensis]
MTVDQDRQHDSRGQGGEAALRMKIGGMSCSFCTNTIRRAYGRIDGVHEVGVSLAHEEGLVKYDPGRVSEDQLKKVLVDVGYTVRDPDKVRSFEEEETELRQVRNRLLVAATFTLVSLALMLFDMWLGWVSVPLLPWIMLTLALETMFVTGWFIKKMAFASLRRGILNQHNLLEFAAFAGLAGGFLGLFVNADFPAGEFFAVATFVTTYHILSDYASKAVRTRSSHAIRKLLELQPDTARVIRDGQELEVPTDQVEAGELVRIRPGESVPVDGEVVEGASAVDQSLVTGESIPEEKVAGDELIGGSVNQTGTLVVRVSRVGEESFLKQVARSIEEARALRPGILQLVDVVLKYFVPAVLVFAAAAFVFWTLAPLLWGQGPDLFRATFAALAVLVLGYPCALGMATPLAMIRGGGEAARRGILMRSGEAFQVMRELSAVVLDKTGTITRGEPRVRELVPVGGGDEAELLRLAAAVEAPSEHPLARAVEDAAEERGLDVPRAEQFTSHTGRGVQASVDGARVLVGKPAFLTEHGVDTATAEQDLARLEEGGQTVVAVARDQTLLGLIGIADTVKDDAAQAVRRMRDANLDPVMITGDNERTARAVATEVGITQVLAQVMPEDKAAQIRRLQREEGRRVAMVGDGINDAPALTQADVGIAIGAGTDIAIESADIVIMGERLGAVVDAYQIGTRSYTKTKQNLALAFAFNGIGVPAATTGLVHPVWAMVAMVASVTSVLANSFAGRLLRRAAEVGKAPAAAEKPARAAEETERVLRLSVGMHCAGCAENIGRSLPQIEGVRSAVADHERGTVEIVHLPGKVSEDEICEHLRELGYAVTGHREHGLIKHDQRGED